MSFLCDGKQLNYHIPCNFLWLEKYPYKESFAFIIECNHFQRIASDCFKKAIFYGYSMEHDMR